MTVKELIDLLSKLPDHSDEVVIEVNHGDLRDIVSLTNEKVNNHGTIVCDDEEEEGKNVVVISV